MASLCHTLQGSGEHWIEDRDCGDHSGVAPADRQLGAWPRVIGVQTPSILPLISEEGFCSPRSGRPQGP